MWEVVPTISNSNHMPERAIWDKLPERIFENFEISNFSKITKVTYPKNRPKHVINKQTLITPKKQHYLN